MKKGIKRLPTGQFSNKIFQVTFYGRERITAKWLRKELKHLLWLDDTCFIVKEIKNAKQLHRERLRKTIKKLYSRV